MRYTITIIFCIITIIGNGYGQFFRKEPSVYGMFIFILNLVIVWFIGRYIDRYISVKKDLNKVKQSLIQYTYGLDTTMDGVGVTNEMGISNDTLGHEAGDQLLENVANRLDSFQDESISIFHIGGDEFIVLLQADDKQLADEFASMLVHEMEKPFYVIKNEIKITTSIGISCYPNDHDDVEELLKLADSAMYYAKQSGKNRYAFINTKIKDFQARRSFLELELNKALPNKELVLHYQPKVDLQSNRLIGIEALIRWEHPKLGSIAPLEFIPIAEETGLIIAIGKWVINEAVSQMSQWEKEGFPLQISVNVSQRQLRNDSKLVSYIQSCLEEHQFKPEHLELEITESVMEHFDKIIPVLNELKHTGIKISIDDFGTGFSSLGSIKHLPIDYLKIDQTFIGDIVFNRTDLAIVKSIIDIGRNLEIIIVAEGIETNEHLNILKELNCSLGQGYYFSQPLSSKQFKEKFLVK